MLLSDKEIDAIEAKCWASLESDNPICFSRAIESAVLAKLQEQEPVCWYYYGENGKKYYCEDAGYLDLRHPLYAFPQPAVEQDDRRDAERYRWLKSRKGLLLETAYAKWTKPSGEVFTASHRLCADDTAHAPFETLDSTVDAAMAQGEKK